MIKFKKFLSHYEGEANHKKMPLSAFLFLILILCSSFFISCENSITPSSDFYSDTQKLNPPEKQYVPVERYVDISGRYTTRGTIPSELLASMESYEESRGEVRGFSRSAIPTPGSDKNQIRYYAKATASEEVEVRGTVNATERTFAIPHLKIGPQWTVEVGMEVLQGTDDEGHEIWTRCLYAISEPKTFNESDFFLSSSLILLPDTNGHGAVELNMTIDSTAGLSGLVIKLDDEEQRNKWNAALAADTSKEIEPTKIKVSNVPSGVYDLTLQFMAGGTYPVYTTTQTINVINGMTTDSWKSDGTGLITSSGTGTTFNLTSDIISDYVDSCIYVGANLASASVSNNNEGKAYSPLATLQEAINRIKTANLSRHYTIFVSGNVTGAVSIEQIEETGATATFPSTAAASITIIGLNGLDSNNYPRDGINGNGSAIALKINTGTIKVNIKDLQISGATAYCLRIDTGSDVTLNAGVLIGSVTDNPEDGANYGIDNRGKLRINGSKILGNQVGVTSYGDTSYLEMNGGKISNNYVTGVMIGEDSSEPGKLNAKFYGTEISYNGNFGIGGGVQVRERTVTQFYNCSIKNNVAQQGGGFYSRAHSLSINNCRIENNEATENGGGLWIESSDELILSNTTIKNNISDCLYGIEDGYGGALYIHIYLTSFKISGNIDIPYGVNGDTGQGKNDVGFSVGNKITISGPLTCPNPIVLIPFDPLRSYPLIEVDDINVTSITPYKDYFVLSTNDFLLKANSEDNALVLDAPIYVAGDASTRQVCTANGSDTGDGTKSAPFATIEQAINDIIALHAIMDLNAAENYTIYVDGEIFGAQRIPDTLTTDEASSLTIQGASGNTSDILNGKVLGSDPDSVLTINSAVPVTIKDLRIKGGNATNGGGINMISGSTVTLESGALIGGTNESDPTSGSAPANSETASANYADKGGGIYSQGNLTLKNGSAVIYNYANDGGGICCNGGSLTIEAGAKVNLNGTNTTGGGITTYGTALSMTGGEVCNNISNSGVGGLDITKDSSNNCPTLITISGATISGNSADSAGGAGGIYYSGGQTLAITGNTVISGNHCKFEGGGIRVQPGVLELSDCTISGNYSNNGTRPGGGIAANSGGSIKLSGSVYIPTGATIGGTVHYGEGCNDVRQNYGSIKIKGALTPPAECTDGIIATITPNTAVRGSALLEAEGSITNLTSYKDNFALTYADAGWKLKLSSDNTALTLDAPIYVSTSGSSAATTTGTKNDPFRTIQDAISTVLTDTNVDYTILIDGELRATTVNNNGTINGYAQEIIDPGEPAGSTIKAKSITIRGASASNGNPTDEINGLSADGTKRARGLFIGTKIPVTIENLKITGGLADEGGGIYLSGEDTTLTLGNDVLITGNKANNSGGGIYLTKNTINNSCPTLNIKGNVKICDNTNSVSGDPSNLYLPEGAKITVLGALKKGDEKAQIGISTENPPTLTSKILFTANYGTKNTGIAPGTYFTGDQWTVAWGSGTTANEAVLAASGGNITIEPVYEDIRISIDKSLVLKSATEKKFTFSASGTDSEGNTNPITIGSGEGQLALTIDSVTYHGETVPASYYDTGTNYVTLGNSLPAGNYTINTRAVYQGSLSEARTYSASFPVKIVEVADVTSVVTSIKSMTASGTISVSGAIDYGDLISIVSAISEIQQPSGSSQYDPPIKVTLDLSKIVGLTEINSIFDNHWDIEQIILPEGITKINGIGRVDNCVTLNIPSTVTEISDFAFYRCKSNITLDEGNTAFKIVGDGLYTMDGKIFVAYCKKHDEHGSCTIASGTEKIADGAFSDAENLETIIFASPSLLTEIGQEAFDYCSSLGDVVIPDTVTTLGPGAFQYAKVTSMTLSSNITEIKSETFSNNDFTEIVIPDGVTRIGGGAFWACHELETITLPTSVTNIADAFGYCENLTTVNYKGSEEQRNAITIDSGSNNDALRNATWVYNYTGD